MNDLTDILMNPADELLWEQDGFFDKVDSLIQNRHHFFQILLCPLFPPRRTLHLTSTLVS
jgi:hypothetical protein